MTAWNLIATRACGCEIKQLDAPKLSNHGEVNTHSPAQCIYHLCRLCGAVPLADSEPDSLCNDCFSMDASS